MTEAEAGAETEAKSEAKTAAAIVIGDEILSGRTRDANAHHLAGVLAEIGVRLREIRVVPDETPAIVEAVRALSARVDFVFTSGGIGPTHDDITADAVAEAFGVSIDVRDDALRILQDHYGATDINPARLRMARIPDGAQLIDNPLSRAPGFRLGNVFVMAGVPDIFRAMLDVVRPDLGRGRPIHFWSFRADAPEGDLAADVGALDAAHPDVGVGVYPFHRRGMGCVLVLRSDDQAALSAAAAAARTLLNARATEVIETPPAQSGAWGAAGEAG